MKIHQFKKALAFIRFLIIKLFLNKSGGVNFIYSNVSIVKKNKIYLGKKNIINSNACLIVDPGQNTQTIKMGNNNVIASSAILKTHGGYIKIGSNNFVGERTQIQGRGGIEIGNNVLIAANVFISSSNHDFQNPNSVDYLKKEVPKKIQINKNVWIGANSVIIAGIHIAKYAIVAAGSVVTKDVEAYTMVAGNPAKPLKRFDHDKKEWLRL
jgi:acetyltransferase-like isoleucine patch superfamily enzyme